MDVAAPGTTAAVGMAGEHSHSAVAGTPEAEGQVAQPAPARPTWADDDAELMRKEPPGDAPRRGPAPKGRPPAGTPRTARTIQDNWKRARNDGAKAKAVALAVKAQMLEVLPLEALQWGRAAGVLTQRQYLQAVGAEEPRQESVVQAAPPAAATATAMPQPPPAPTPASTTAAPPASTAQGAAPQGAETQPPATAPAQPPAELYMGQPEETVSRYAEIAHPVVEFLAKRFKHEGFDPSTAKKGILFKGHKRLEKEVDCVPTARMAELLGVLAAERWPSAGGAGTTGQAKKELAVLALATFAPALATAGQRVVGTLMEVGRGIGARLRSRRPGRGGADS